MPSDERLFDLLERWEELQGQGQDISARELCADMPELQSDLEQAIAKLKRVDPHLNLATLEPAPLPVPEPGSASRSSPWPWVSKSASSAPARAGTTPAQQEAARSDEEVPATWRPGDVILGLYEVREVFTGGGRGLVYRVRHRGWGIDLAVKSPRPEYFRTEQDKEDFEEEAKTWVNLSLRQGALDRFLHRRPPRLTLPAAKGRAVVGEQQRVGLPFHS